MSDPTERRLAAILSADAAGYSGLMERDEDATVRAVSDCRELIRRRVREHRGRVVDDPGDELMAEFRSTLDAVRCALAIQSAIGSRNAELPSERALRFRVGVHLGDVRVEGRRLYGDGVNLAARLRELAPPGGVCLSAAVHEQVERKLDVAFEDLGERRVKNIARPIRAWAWRAEGAGAAAVDPAAPAPDPAAPRRIRSLAVLPLENLSGDPEQDYLVDGMTDALIGDLARIRLLRVVSRTSVRRYRGVPKPLPEIARELGVDGVIEGSVAREADRVRVAVQLIDAKSDHHVWAERYERDVRGVLALQSEIARTVARQIEVELTPREEAQLAGPLGRWFARVRRIGVPED